MSSPSMSTFATPFASVIQPNASWCNEARGCCTATPASDVTPWTELDVQAISGRDQPWHVARPLCHAASITYPSFASRTVTHSAAAMLCTASFVQSATSATRFPSREYWGVDHDAPNGTSSAREWARRPSANTARTTRPSRQHASSSAPSGLHTCIPPDKPRPPARPASKLRVASEPSSTPKIFRSVTGPSPVGRVTRTDTRLPEGCTWASVISVPGRHMSTGRRGTSAG